MPASDALRAAWDGGEPWSRTLVAPTRSGDVELVIEVPPIGQRVVGGPETDLRAAFAALDAEPCGIDDRKNASLRDELLRRVTASERTEGAAWHDGRWAGPLIEYMAMELGRTPASLDADELEELLFRIVPRAEPIVIMTPEDATAIVAELRTLYSHLEREWALPQASACLALLDEAGIERLSAALAQPTNRRVAATHAANMRAPARPFDASAPDGNRGARSLPPEARKQKDKKKKDKRKAARKARGKNR